MSQENQQMIAENEVQQQERYATDMVINSDISVAEQATGYAVRSPEEAELVARDAVMAAVNGTANQTLGGEHRMPQEAELQATQAVEATDYTQ